jgi:hypothetical protein
MEVIMDTGATFTMLPGQYEFAWTNKKPCLHTIEGCFKGGYLQAKQTYYFLINQIELLIYQKNIL